MSATAVVPQPERHYSFSAISTYLKCPRHWQHKYMLGTVPSHKPGALAFGSAVHAALALFYARLMHGMEEPGVDELTGEFSDAWRRELAGDLPVLLDGNDTPDALQDRGVAMVKAFHRDASRPTRVLAVEEGFSIDILDPGTAEVLPKFVGRFDALVVTAGGQPLLLEHKTAARRYSETRLAHDLQPTAYSLALSTLGIEAGMAYQVLLKTKAPEVVLYEVARTSQDHDDLVQTIIGVHRAIEAGAFYPIRDWWCRGCQYAGPCLAG